MGLDLYAKAEHLLGIEESTERLHDLYIQTLKKYPVKTLLDIGCGRGFLMEKAQELGMVCTGIDQSAVMVEAVSVCPKAFIKLTPGNSSSALRMTGRGMGAAP